MFLTKLVFNSFQELIYVVWRHCTLAHAADLVSGFLPRLSKDTTGDNRCQHHYFNLLSWSVSL